MNRHAGTGTWNATHAAKRDVTRAERALARRLEEAGAAGQATVDRALSLVRPVVIGAVAVAGLVWLVSALRRPRRRGWVPPPRSKRPFLMNEALRAASISLASAAARHLGEQLFSNTETQSTPTGRAVPPRTGNNPPRL